MKIPTGSFSIGPNNWRQDLAWAHAYGTKIEALKQYYGEKSSFELSMLTVACHFVADTLETKKLHEPLTESETELFDFCIKLLVDLM